MFLYVTSDTLCTAAESAHVHTARKSPPVVSAKGLALAAARLPCISSSRQPCWRCRQVVAMLSQSHEVGISRISIHRWDGRSLLIPFQLDEWQGWHFLQWLLTMHDSSWLNGCLQILSGGSVWELPKNHIEATQFESLNPFPILCTHCDSLRPQLLCHAQLLLLGGLFRSFAWTASFDTVSCQKKTFGLLLSFGFRLSYIAILPPR